MRYSLFGFLISFFLLVVACNAEEASKTPVFSKDLLQKAESGDAAAQLEIAACYGEGLGVEKNQKTAFDWAKKSADQGFSKASLVLARCYLFGWGVPWNESKAEKIFQEAEAGNPRAQDDLGNFFSGKYGRTEKKDIPQALSWWEKAAAQGYAPSQNKLGRAYLDGFGVEKDPTKAFELFQKSADQKHSGAESELGYCYRDGKGVGKDIIKAKGWFEKSANQGNPDGLASLGEFYQNGWADTPINLAKAIDLYQKAADKNHAWSQNRLGHLYWKGIGLEKNEIKAFELYQRSAENGNMYAQNTLGMFYYNGIGQGAEKSKDPRKPAYRKNDFQKAFEWTRKSAENGNPDAQYNLAIFYWRGEGTEGDLEKAKFWMAKAAERNVPKAKGILGWITLDRNVRGISENWFSLGEDSKEESSTNPQ